MMKKKKSRTAVGDANVGFMQRMQKMLDLEMDIEPHGNPKLCFDGSIEEYTEIAVTLGFLVLWGVSRSDGAGKISVDYILRRSRTSRLN